jgi:hypothetical protein
LREARRCERTGGSLATAGPIVAELVGGHASGIDRPLALRVDRYCRLEYTPRRA